ncbi:MULTISPECIES: hypothetical protein [Paracoccus]|uniref:hypothetical protein n=1 Tax=Paracoccus TaxID=265 RepID=UPI00258CBDBE|nr:hypothetical protein [Paracoccus sp. (in: a-proteobacteria)]
MRAMLAWIGDWLPPSLYFALAGNPADPSTGDPDMTVLPSLLARLRQSSRSFEDLPDTIPTPWRDANVTDPLPVEAATIDDIAFAVVAANAEVSAAIQRCSALERLHRLAREAGAVGTDRAVEAALTREGQ